MSKDPAFLFYPNDWIGGTMGMTLEEKGAYIELLIMQFNRGHMTKHMIGLMVGQLWVKVEDKFEVDKDGLYFNKRLDDEKEKRKKFTESRRNNISGKNQYSKPIKKGGHMTSHMENENENENINENENKVKQAVIYPFETKKFLEQWQYWKNYKSKEFNFKYKTIQSEQAALKKLAKLSGNNEEIAIQIIHESFANSWKGFFKLKNNGKTNSETGNRDQYFREHDPDYLKY